MATRGGVVAHIKNISYCADMRAEREREWLATVLVLVHGCGAAPEMSAGIDTAVPLSPLSLVWLVDS